MYQHVAIKTSVVDMGGSIVRQLLETTWMQRKEGKSHVLLLSIKLVRARIAFVVAQLSGDRGTSQRTVDVRVCVYV